MKNTLTSLLSLFLLLSSYHAIAQSEPAKREFRAVWIATVKNLDWPSRAGLSTEQQQREIREMLDFHQKNGINAIIMQVRPSADAFYFSAEEPWSEWLSGQQGKPPYPWYDPLTYFIEESHKRGMEFHAWFNPFRALVDADRNKLLSVNHISNKRPDWLVQYGKNLYFDPGIPRARDYVSDIILDVVNRYDIDAVHFDDYFYPYRIANEEFPDTSSYEAYGGGFVNKDDWRRQNVDSFVESINYRIKAVKSHVKLGISPFGVWRNIADDPLGSDTRAGQTSYDDLYADIRAWLLKGWIDYVVPQLYFSIGYPPADYEILAKWWSQNEAGRHLYVGKGPYKIDNNADQNWSKPNEITRQLELDKTLPAIKGSVYFRAGTFTPNPQGLNDSLQTNYYRHKALIPQMPWLNADAPQSPANLDASMSSKGLILSWNEVDKKDEGGYYVLYKQAGKSGPDPENPANILAIIQKGESIYIDQDLKEKGFYTYLLTSVNRLHQENPGGATVTVKVKRKDLR